MIEYYVMTESDLPTVLAIENEVAQAPWSKGIFVDCLRSGYFGFLLKYNQQSIGFSMMSIAVGECHLLNIAIKKQWQQQGFGKKLLAFILEEAKHNQAQQLFLEVRVSNHHAKHLYQSMGFNEIDRRKDYYPASKDSKKKNKREDALIFALELL